MDQYLKLTPVFEGSLEPIKHINSQGNRGEFLIGWFRYFRGDISARQGTLRVLWIYAVLWQSPLMVVSLKRSRA